MLGAIAEGPTVIYGFLEKRGIASPRKAALRSARRAHRKSANEVRVEGVGRRAAPSGRRARPRNLRTALLLLTGRWPSTVATELTGDASLKTRPMERVA